HNITPAVNSAYIVSEIASVLRVCTTFMACGRNDSVVRKAAAAPIISSVVTAKSPNSGHDPEASGRVILEWPQGRQQRYTMPYDSDIHFDSRDTMTGGSGPSSVAADGGYARLVRMRRLANGLLIMI